MYGVNKNDLDQMLSDIENEVSIFSKKEYFDTLRFPPSIIGRKREVKSLLRFLSSYKRGFVVPFISVYGKSGTGKSLIVRFVCENLKWVLPCFVNLRKAKTVFGCANLILNELGIPCLKSAQGINAAIENITDSITSILDKEQNKLFVLVLDEFDALFLDRRGGSSDFVYKLLTMEQKLQEKGHHACIIAISNSLLADYDLDDRVRSRIGSSEISFIRYSKEDIVEMLKERAGKALSVPVDDDVIDYCAEQSSQDGGDARRAIDLLRVAAELTGQAGKITKEHVDEASEKMHDERIINAMCFMMPQSRFVCAAIARMAYVSDTSWLYTSDIYRSYCTIMQNDMTHSEQRRRGKIIQTAAKKLDPAMKILADIMSSVVEYPQLSYRRVSDLLKDLENMGIVISRTGSKGRYGYGNEYKLTLPAEIIGPYCIIGWWDKVMADKESILSYKASRLRPRW